MLNEDARGDTAVVSCRTVGDRAVIVITGELDMNGAADVAAAVEQALRATPRRLEVDVGDLAFIDSAGVQSLLLARAAAQDNDAEFELSAVSEAVERVIEMASVREALLPTPPAAPEQ